MMMLIHTRGLLDTGSKLVPAYAPGAGIWVTRDPAPLMRLEWVSCCSTRAKGLCRPISEEVVRLDNQQ